MRSSKLPAWGCFTALSLEGEAPWDAGDQALRDMYEDNRRVILADTRIDRGRKVVYNLPTVNIRTGLHEINDKLDQGRICGQMQDVSTGKGKSSCYSAMPLTML